MKEYFSTVVFRKRKIGNLLTVIAATIMLLVSIFYISIPGGNLKIEDDSQTLTFLCTLVGSLISLSLVFFHKEILEKVFPCISLILYAIGLGRQMYLLAYPLADKITGVNWFGGSLATYISIFLL